MPHWLRPLAAVALGVLMLNAPAAQAGELSDPTGSVILVVGGAITEANVALQREVLDTAGGPVFAYCASGNRCSIVWAMANAGRRPTDELIATAARCGYNLEPFRDRIDGFAVQG